MSLFRIIPCLLALVAGLVITSPSARADIKAATVDIDKLIAEYHVAKKELSPLRTERDKHLNEREKQQQALQEATEKLKSIFAKLRDKAMPLNERNNLEDEKESLLKQHAALTKQLEDSADNQLKLTEEKLAVATTRMLTEIRKVIRQYAADNGYQWVIDTSGNSNTRTSPLIYARDAVDITGDILAILNKGAPKQEDEAPATEPVTE